MSNWIPEPTRTEIFEEVFRLADEHSYLNSPRPENSRFMAALVENAKVGVRLAEYIGAGKVRTYIKDTILNKYAKLRRQPQMTIGECARKLAGSDVEELDTGTEKVWLFSGGQNALFLISTAPFKHWEVGLRRLLIYTAARAEVKAAKPQLALLVHGFCYSEPDKDLLRAALEIAGVTVLWDRHG